MIFRLTRKLSKKIDVGALSTVPLDESPWGDWSARLFTADRTQYILLSNTVSLCSVVMYGRGIAHDGKFIERALSEIRAGTPGTPARGTPAMHSRELRPCTRGRVFPTDRA